MKRLNRFCALSLVVLAILATDSQSSGTGHLPAIFEPTAVTSFPTSFPTYLTNESSKDFRAKQAARQFAQIIEFVRTNLANLTADMAKGKGQYLSNLAEMLAIAPARRAFFYTLTQHNFTELVPDSRVTAEELVEGFVAELAVMDAQSFYPQPLEFVRVEWENIIADMAKGQGLYLSVLADKLLIPLEKRAAFYAMTQNKFPQLVPPNLKATFAEDLLAKLNYEISHNLSKPIILSKPLQSPGQKRFDVSHQNRLLFVHQVKVNLINEIQGGAGNRLLKKIAVFFNVPFEKRPLFYTVCKNKLSPLTSNYEISPEQLLSKLEAEVAKL